MIEDNLKIKINEVLIFSKGHRPLGINVEVWKDKFTVIKLY
ncbi:MAG: hypothetical protein PWP54_988 [Thermosipho sp. (in: thermotogales)]|nr:hypothetical protein [Thermosipho sp. (in: thermotogales)]